MLAMFDVKKKSAGKVTWRYEPAIKHTSSHCLYGVVRIQVSGRGLWKGRQYGKYGRGPYFYVVGPWTSSREGVGNFYSPAENNCSFLSLQTCNCNWHVKFYTRLRDREKSRDWSTLEKKHRNRSWSAESYQGEKFVLSRKPRSPQHLPRLENRPTSADSNYHQDLKRGILNVIPPVPVRQQNDHFER